MEYSRPRRVHKKLCTSFQDSQNKVYYNYNKVEMHQIDFIMNAIEYQKGVYRN